MINDVVLEGIVVKAWKFAGDLIFRLVCYRDPALPREWTLEDGRVALDAPVPGRVYYRMKSVVGYWFNDATVDVKPGEGEQVVLTHRATDRAVFARGALEAAVWLSRQPPGRYRMRDMLSKTGG